MREKIIALFLFIAVVGVVTTVAFQHKAPGWKNATCEAIPRFSDFKSAPLFLGIRPSITGSQFDLGDWGKELISATTSAINYAGEYVVKAKPCQKTGCVQHLMINIRTGYVASMGLFGKQMAEFRSDSSLFILETTSTTSAQKTFYQIKDSKMELVCYEN